MDVEIFRDHQDHRAIVMDFLISMAAVAWFVVSALWPFAVLLFLTEIE